MKKVVLTYKDLNEKPILFVLDTLCACKILSLEEGRKLLKLRKQFRDVYNQASVKYTSLLKKYCILDEKGNIVPRLDENNDPIPNTFFIAEGKEDEFRVELDQFFSEAIELEIEPIELKAFNKEYLLSANELDFISGLYVD